ncbi:MAG: putative nicotinate-nucleotide adenylyltransferase, partial [Candidatus Nomurabacteria bacterium GW2011_GWB1_37_5]
TMSELSKKFPDNKFILIFGTDVVNELGKWKDYKKITDNYEIIVFIRDDQKISDKIKKKVKIYGTINSDMPNSSTEIRSLIKSKKPFRYLVPKLVEEYIKENNLYI